MIASSVALSVILAGSPSTVELRQAGGQTQIVKHTPRVNGLPVRGAYELWATAADAASTRVAAREIGSVRSSPDEARVSGDDARALAAARFGWAPDRLELELVYLRHLDAAVLAWEVTSPLDLDPAPARARVWLSASTGAVLARRSLTFDSGALVYPENPASTPTPIEIEFTTIDVAVADAPLASPTIDVRGCVDESDETPPGWWTPGQCFPYARARSDASGDFFVPLPNIGLIADNEATDDLYAEVAAYYYVEQFFERMSERGLDSARCDHFTVVVNRYALDEDGEQIPLGGANFVDECDPERSPTLIIGQGRYADYAYDADILFHEMGHSVIQHLAPDGLADRRFSPTGIVSEAGALHEGVADYLAMSLSGDPEVGEYIGRFGVSGSTPYIRTALHEKVCPDDLVGQWHSDGLIVSGALWAARARVGVVVDEILLQTLPRLPPDATLEDFGRAYMAAAEAFVAAGTLAELDYELIERSLTGRGLLDCPHIIDDLSLATNGKRMVLIAADESIAPFAPGPLQLRYEVPPGETEVTVFFTMSLSSGEGPPAATVLMKIGGEPITFEYGLDDEDVITVTGDWDLAAEAELLNGHDFIARVPVAPGDVLHVALANRTAGGVSVSNFFVVASDVEAEVEGPGCGCVSAGGGAGPFGAGPFGWIGGLALLLLGGLGRRRRARGVAPTCRRERLQARR
ncbi:hypothetical protein ENSA5_48020 [Enhygromyxa salina]|uniref:FTP domain-containing protein n=1 Tax=Enhygromyxa salina TaxID=215803 RepID=A0A2S9XIW2_9BACT|nr:hypothetical protein [Enhygromyxa salina]PRP92621.1 hypothetical protein ENSA5_48020 [Enhygromyxa salina]